MSGIALVLPPGWTLHPGGPHIALPLLKGFLQQHNIETKLYDLNLGSTNYHKVVIEEEDVISACNQLTRFSMNEVYFHAEDKLQNIAKRYDGIWFAHEGFRRNECKISSPFDIKAYSRCTSPFTDYFKQQAIPHILKHQPKIIGITIIVPTQILQAFEFVRLLRAAGYQDCIVLGGNVVTRLYSDMALDWVFDLIDGLIHLQGERALLEIYRSLEKNTDFSLIPNLTWRNNGAITRNPSALLQPIDFAPPDFEGLPLKQYWGTNYLTMVAGRGCYYGKCSFCAIPFGYGKDNYIGSATSRHVVNAIKNCTKHHGINHFKFIDEALHPKMMRDLATIIQKESFNCTFEAYLRLEKTWQNPELLRMSAAAGLRKVYLGLELVPSDERELLTKADNADPLRLLSELKEAGIKSHVFCMFGFPGTGLKEAFNTIEFALKHHELIDTLDIFPFYYARHTQVSGVTIMDDANCTWNVEHNYEPASEDTLAPSKVNILAERLSHVVWSEHPKWFHPIYRMYSPWHGRIS